MSGIVSTTEGAQGAIATGAGELEADRTAGAAAAAAGDGETAAEAWGRGCETDGTGFVSCVRNSEEMGSMGPRGGIDGADSATPGIRDVTAGEAAVEGA